MNQKEKIEHSIITKYRKKIWRPFMKAVRDFELIQEHDKIAVCISGGKDSMLLAKCLEELQKHGNVSFDLVYLVMDPGYQSVNRKQIEKNLEILGIPATTFESNIFHVAEKSSETRNDNPCYLCARMRRGYLYKEAQRLGCNKIALGHHFDDVIETILLGMFYGAQFQTMMPKLHSTYHEGMELIRPMYYVKEKDILRWVKRNNLDFIKCACKFTRNCDNSNSKRLEMKSLINDLRQVYENIDINIFNSTKNVNLNTVISYKKDGKIYNFLDKYDEKS